MSNRNRESGVEISRFLCYDVLYEEKGGDFIMITNFDTAAYCRYIWDCLKEDGLLSDSRVALQLHPDELKEYCHSHIESVLYEEAVAMVAKLDNTVSEYQQRYNLVGSVSKAFYVQTDSREEYQYLSAEQMILSFTGKDCRFMDWLLSHRQYMDFSESLPDYWKELKTNNFYTQALEQLVETICEKMDAI